MVVVAVVVVEVDVDNDGVIVKWTREKKVWMRRVFLHQATVVETPPSDDEKQSEDRTKLKTGVIGID